MKIPVVLCKTILTQDNELILFDTVRHFPEASLAREHALVRTRIPPIFEGRQLVWCAPGKLINPYQKHFTELTKWISKKGTETIITPSKEVRNVTDMREHNVNHSVRWQIGVEQWETVPLRNPKRELREFDIKGKYVVLYFMDPAVPWVAFQDENEALLVKLGTQ